MMRIGRDDTNFVVKNVKKELKNGNENQTLRICYLTFIGGRLLPTLYE